MRRWTRASMPISSVISERRGGRVRRGAGLVRDTVRAAAGAGVPVRDRHPAGRCPHLAAPGTAVRADGLLTAYAAGLALPFLLAAVALGRTMALFRALRDRYDLVRMASGAVLVVAGLLVFFDRTYILNGWVNNVTGSL